MSTQDRAELTAANAVEQLHATDVTLDAGLSAAEIKAVENRLGCLLPPDLRILLQTVLPVGPRFPTWRDLDSAELAGQLERTTDGIVFDVQHNEAWHPD